MKLDGRQPTGSVIAARANQIDAVGFLLDRGVDIHAVSPRFFWLFDYGATALHHAAASGRVQMVEFLLNRGADPGFPTEDGRTPSDWARWNDETREEITRILESTVSN